MELTSCQVTEVSQLLEKSTRKFNAFSLHLQIDTMYSYIGILTINFNCPYDNCVDMAFPPTVPYYVWLFLSCSPSYMYISRVIFHSVIAAQQPVFLCVAVSPPFRDGSAISQPSCQTTAPQPLIEGSMQPGRATWAKATTGNFVIIFILVRTSFCLISWQQHATP